jgi:hypothetical protein
MVAVLAVAGGVMLTALSEQRDTGGVDHRLAYGAYLGIVMAHFAIDGVVWRRPRTPLPSSSARPLLPSPAIGGH